MTSGEKFAGEGVGKALKSRTGFFWLTEIYDITVINGPVLRDVIPQESWEWFGIFPVKMMKAWILMKYGWAQMCWYF